MLDALKIIARGGGGEEGDRARGRGTKRATRTRGREQIRITQISRNDVSRTRAALRRARARAHINLPGVGGTRRARAKLV